MEQFADAESPCRSDQAEIEIGMFSRRCLGKRRIGNLADLAIEAQAWNQRINRDHVTIEWKFTRKKAAQNSTTQSRGRSSRGQLVGGRSAGDGKLSAPITHAKICQPTNALISSSGERRRMLSLM